MRQQGAQQAARNEVEAAINELQKEIVNARRKGLPTDSQQHTLQLLKQKKIELDRWLDNIEDVTEADLAADRKQLTEWIILRDSSQRAIWSSLQEQLDHLAYASSHLAGLLVTSHALALFLERALAEAESMRSGGFLRYIAGLNPNLVITTCLTGMETTALQNLAKLEQLPPSILSADSVTQLQQLLTTIIHRSRAKWRWGTLAKELKIDLNQLTAAMTFLTEAQTTLENQQNALKIRIKQWLLEDATGDSN